MTILSILLTLFLVTIVVINSHNPISGFLSSIQIMIAVVSGALGATISRALRIRDLGTISEIRELWTSYLRQNLIGAALASIRTDHS